MSCDICDTVSKTATWFVQGKRMKPWELPHLKEKEEMTIEVRDDSGDKMGVLVMPELEVDDFVEQLPEGWTIEILSQYY